MPVESALGKLRSSLILCTLLISSFCVEAQELKLGLPLGHLGSATTINYSSDGAYILTASLDRTAKLFHRETGFLVQSFEGHVDALIEARFFADEKQVLTGSKDGTVRLFDIESGKLIKVFDQHQPLIRLACKSQ